MPKKPEPGEMCQDCRDPWCQCVKCGEMFCGCLFRVMSKDADKFVVPVDLCWHKLINACPECMYGVMADRLAQLERLQSLRMVPDLRPAMQRVIPRLREAIVMLEPCYGMNPIIDVLATALDDAEAALAAARVIERVTR